MKAVARTCVRAASTALLSCAAMTAVAQDVDLEITMEVIDELSDIERSGFLTERPNDASLFEIDPGSEEEERERTSLFDQFSAMDGEFRVKNADDGFETDLDDKNSRRALETESDFEDGEDLELDLIEDVMDPIADPDPMT